jgi:hypothetical protein
MGIMMMLLGAAILVGSTMISGLRFHCFLQQRAPGLAASPLTRDRLVLAGFVIGSVMAARFFEKLAW